MVSRNILFLLVFIFSYIISYAQFESGIIKPTTSPTFIDEKKDLYNRYGSLISPQNLKKHLSIIASDSLEGRDVGTPGIQKAEEYIVNSIKQTGLFTYQGNNYKQPVSFTTQKWLDTDVYVDGERFKHLQDYLALTEDNDNKELIRDSEVLFLGYGIEDSRYNDYKKVNAEGKIIIILEGEPRNKKGNYVISGDTVASEWSSGLEKKLLLAKSKGVKMVIIVPDDFEKLLNENRRKFFRGHTVEGDVTKKKSAYPNHIYASEKLYKYIVNKNKKQFSKIEKSLAKGKVRSGVFTCDFIATLAREDKVLTGNNIVGYIQGKTYPDEYIIVSAHFDHVGRKGTEIFNGADDNGSGTVALLELARVIQQSTYEGNRPDRSIVFLWLTAEEKGLLGSRYYADNPLFPLENTVANINIDMIGRRAESYSENSEDYVYVIGSDRLSSGLHESILDMHEKYSSLTLDFKYNDVNDPNQYYYRSDHYNFAKKGIPSVFYFNGTHPDYHRGTDTIDKIDFDLMALRTKHICHVVWDLANRPDRIKADAEQK